MVRIHSIFESKYRGSKGESRSLNEIQFRLKFSQKVIFHEDFDVLLLSDEFQTEPLMFFRIILYQNYINLGLVPIMGQYNSRNII